MEKKPRVITKWLYWFLFAVSVIFVYKALDNFSNIMNAIGNLLEVVVPFLIGILLAYLLYVPCKRLENLISKSKKLKKHARGLSVLTVYLVVALLIIILIKCVLPPVISSITDLVTNFQSYYGIFLEKYSENEKVDELINLIKEIDFTKYMSVEAITDYAKGAINIASGVFTALVSVVVSIYILLDRTKIVAFFKRLASAIFPESTYNNLDKYFDRTNDIFFKFIASQVLDAIVIGIMVSIAMAVMKVKYGVFLGFLIGFFNMIPYIGAIIAIGIALVITLFTGGIVQTIWLGVVVIILQQIDSNIINPKIVGDSLKISPLLVIFSVTVGGAYFGVIGMFLAVPIAAVIKVALNDYIDMKENMKKKKLK